ncbi:MAG: MBL fold metallo-hydrolase [Gemmatimonadaceae bacterium]
MRLTTLGTGTISLDPHRARAGHLVETGAVRLLLDCGSGIAQRLAAFGGDWRTITHIALTHFHIDHTGDLPTLIFAWKYGDIPARREQLEIIGPAGTAAFVQRLADAYGAWVADPGFPITVREIASGEGIELCEGVELAAAKVPHTDESVAYSVSADERRLVYTGDTGFDAALGEWAAGASALLAECSLPDEMAIPEHLTPRRCGALAAAAAPRLLALTHFYPPVERVDIRAEVGKHFSGEIVLATDGWSMEI